MHDTAMYSTCAIGYFLWFGGVAQWLQCLSLPRYGLCLVGSLSLRSRIHTLRVSSSMIVLEWPLWWAMDNWWWGVDSVPCRWCLYIHVAHCSLTLVGLAFFSLKLVLFLPQLIILFIISMCSEQLRLSTANDYLVLLVLTTTMLRPIVTCQVGQVLTSPLFLVVSHPHTNRLCLVRENT